MAFGANWHTCYYPIHYKVVNSSHPRKYQLTAISRHTNMCLNLISHECSVIMILWVFSHKWKWWLMLKNSIRLKIWSKHINSEIQTDRPTNTNVAYRILGKGGGSVLSVVGGKGQGDVGMGAWELCVCVCVCVCVFPYIYLLSNLLKISICYYQDWLKWVKSY